MEVSSGASWCVRLSLDSLVDLGPAREIVRGLDEFEQLNQVIGGVVGVVLMEIFGGDGRGSVRSWETL